MYSGYLDRFTDDNNALILIDALQKQFHVSRSLLPAGSSAGTWFVIGMNEDKIISLQIDAEKSSSVKQDIDDRMKRLKANKTSRFKRN
ncbi:DUF3006 domain-containing protein [Sporosarcina sp. CAU 1771]